VQSQFGWHVIKVEDKKMSAPQPFEQLAQQLSQEVLFQTFDKVVGDLKANAAVTIPDPTLAAEVKSQNEAQAAAEEAPAEEAPAPDAPATDAPAEAAPAQ
jgi:peptidyl-prolyl cis-trans isomerase C